MLPFCDFPRLVTVRTAFVLAEVGSWSSPANKKNAPRPKSVPKHSKMRYKTRVTSILCNRLIFRKEYFGYHGSWENESNVSRGSIESQWQTGAHNNIDAYVIPILEKQNWRVYHFHDTGRSAKVKQEHNISNNKVLMNDAGNLAAFLFRLKNNYARDCSYYSIDCPILRRFCIGTSRGKRRTNCTKVATKRL